ncbi:MAG: crossover junction endodeoxyribonuclease RuvC [Pseudohongiellaceae bacterium]|jgi:crossover junction endodeoxyribonuclease RuvC
MIVMGIDPGSRRTGWAVVRQVGSRLQLIDLGVLIAREKAPLPERLGQLHDGLSILLSRHNPELAAVESVFHGPNTRSLVVLGQARGALLAALGKNEAAFDEMSPAEVKKAVTGKGGATKEQVAHMVGVMLGPTLTTRLQILAEAGLPASARLDATDAAAIAIAAIHRQRFASRVGEGLAGKAGTAKPRTIKRGAAKSRWGAGAGARKKPPGRPGVSGGSAPG